MVGGNLIFKYKAKSIAFAIPDWIRYITKQLKCLAKENNMLSKETSSQIYQLNNYTKIFSF